MSSGVGFSNLVNGWGSPLGGGGRCVEACVIVIVLYSCIVRSFLFLFSLNLVCCYFLYWLFTVSVNSLSESSSGTSDNYSV